MPTEIPDFTISKEEQQIRESIAAREFKTDADPLNPDWSKRVENPMPEEERGPALGPNDRRVMTADIGLLEELRGPKRDGPGAQPRNDVPGFRAAGPREQLHFDPTRVAAAIVTSGGVSPGLNTVVDQIVRRHWLYARQRGPAGVPRPDIKGFTNGFRGLVDGTFVPLNPQLTESWPRRGGSMLRQLRESVATRPKAETIVDTLRKFEINILYVAGGDGTLKTAAEIKRLLDDNGMNIAVVHIPKTMDNDIPWVSESFGFQTAIAEAARLVNALRDEAESNNRIGVVEVYGAGVGHTAAHTALGSGEVDAVLIPEQGPLNIELILDHLDRRALGRGRKGYAMILAAENAKLDLDSSDPGSLLKRLEARFPIRGVESRVFVNKPRHLIRAVAAGCHDQLYCRQLGNCAVDCALAGYSGFSVSRWLDNYVMVPFVRTVGHKRHLPLNGMVWKQVMNLTGQPAFS